MLPETEEVLRRLTTGDRAYCRYLVSAEQGFEW